MSESHREKVNFIWALADILRGSYKPHEYGSVILPLTVMRRLDQVLEPTRADVVRRAEDLRDKGVSNPDEVLKRIAGQQFWNSSGISFQSLMGDPPLIADNLRAHIVGYSPLAAEVLEKFDFDRQIDRLHRAGLLFPLVARFADVDLHPDRVPAHAMGYIFEELIRRFSEQSNETAGEHFTPREVIRLMVNVLLIEDEAVLSAPGTVRTIYDCACGTGGMLSESETHLRSINRDAQLKVFGQELNPESFAICLSDMLVKGQDASQIAFGNSLTEDGHAGRHFDYLIANPPFGVDWSSFQQEIRDEHEQQGDDGRFGPGLPSVDDGSMLFLLHLAAKMKSSDTGGSRLAIVLPGGALQSGGAGSGESKIREWVIKQDLLEAIIGLPEELFYNTEIASYIWVLNNRKPPKRQGCVQLIDARDLGVKLRRPLGKKRYEIPGRSVDDITRLFGSFCASDRVAIVPNAELGYQSITVDRALRGRFEITPDTWVGLENERSAARLDPDALNALRAELGSLPMGPFTDYASCAAAVSAAAERAIGGGTAALLRALALRCCVREEDGAVVLDGKGRPVADPEARDKETIALGVDPDSYARTTVGTPEAPAWVVRASTKEGYDIPFGRFLFRNRHLDAHADVAGDIHRTLEAVESVIRKVIR